MTHGTTALRTLTNQDLVHHIESLARDERACTTQILQHLNELERRKVHLDLGYSSLFDYCVRKLKYSSSAAGRRIAAARCIRCFPETLSLIEGRELSLSTISLVEPILNEENVATILERVRGASHRDVERLVSEYRPPVALRDRIRPVRVAASEPVQMDALLFERECARITPDVWEHRVQRTEEKMHVQFLASVELVEKFERARALLVSRNSDASFADVLEVLVTEFLARRDPVARHAKRVAKHGEKDPHSRRREWEKTQSRHIPASVRDEVFARDGSRCAHVARDGTRCNARKRLEVDHVEPFALGGGHDAANLRLLCAPHNLRAAENALGTPVMSRFWARE